MAIAVLLDDKRSIQALIKHGAKRADSCEIGPLVLAIGALNQILPKDRADGPSFDNIMQSQTAIKCYLQIGKYRPSDRPKDETLIRSIVRGDVDGVGKLLKRGADRNAREAGLPGKDLKDKGRTVLQISLLEGQSEITALLLRSGADPNARANLVSRWGGWPGFTALMLAIELEMPDAVKLLLDNHAGVLVKDDNGYLAIHHAAAGDHAEVARMLLEASSEADQRTMLKQPIDDVENMNALTTAAHYRAVEAAQFLIRRGVELLGKDYVTDNSKQALLDLVTNKEYSGLGRRARSESRTAALSIAAALLDNGADPNEADDESNTILMRAITGGSGVDMIELLLDRGADPGATNALGQTADHFASARTDGGALKLALELRRKPAVKRE